jgi:hypothetical protein
MALTFSIQAARPFALVRAAVIVLRAAHGLLGHGLLYPGRPAVIERASGRVRAA